MTRHEPQGPADTQVPRANVVHRSRGYPGFLDEAPYRDDGVLRIPALCRDWPTGQESATGSRGSPPGLRTYLLWSVHPPGVRVDPQARGVRRGPADPHLVPGQAYFTLVGTPTLGLIYELGECDGVPWIPTGPRDRPTRVCAPTWCQCWSTGKEGATGSFGPPPGLGTGLLNPGRCTHLVSGLVSRPGERNGAP